MGRETRCRPSHLLWPDDRRPWHDFLLDAACRLQFEEDLTFTLKHDLKEPMGTVGAELLARLTGLV